MAIDWQRLPARDSGLPFNGDEILLAVPHVIGAVFGGDGKKVDPDHPYTLHLARWDNKRLEWATNETNDDTGGVLWLSPSVPILWAEIELPS